MFKNGNKVWDMCSNGLSLKMNKKSENKPEKLIKSVSIRENVYPDMLLVNWKIKKRKS